MRPHRVAVLALDDVIPLDFALPVQVFAGSFYRDSSAAGWPYRVQVCASRPTVRTTVGFSITADVGLRGLARADTVVVPGFEPHGRPLDPAVLSALRRAHARGARMISICVGAFALAQAGLLDGRSATTHWQFATELASHYPAVDVRPDVLYVDDGDVLTSAGVSSGLDLCLHVVRKDLGVDTARRVAQALVAAPHREGNQAQFIPRPLDVTGTGPIAELCEWIKDNPREDLTLDDMAARCSMSARTFTRHFRDTTGTTPLQWVLSRRLDDARRMLEATELSVDEVAERCGFGTTLNLRSHFRRRLDTTPTAYRHTFKAASGRRSAELVTD
jgi:transcriptional regulator GlxA family with amidase domain